jgi:hypothetical protein
VSFVPAMMLPVCQHGNHASAANCTSACRTTV